MTDRDLPVGVPPDNQGKSKGSFQAPDMATPQFAAEETPLDHAAASTTRKEYKERVRLDDDDDDDIISFPSIGGGNTLLYLAIAAILAALLAIIVMNNRSGLPLCSDQPDWNQYNCRTG